MPVIVTLDGMLAARGLTLTELSQAVDITIANLSILKTGKAKAIRFSTLEAICTALDCQPGDILSFTAEGETA
ncbi:putative transcriptional regulator [Sphingomonas sp. PP-F2F-G114-C0414]|uniref:helix-turn-helix domain-containing protein n=1 Tax=Sphingomonas sp. PP-F2F-G114-C0414 TaxID=2135662 RepID=UPI000EF909D8|nr:helix-turn-helix transcriptional regulator [Sphingomonas sp. PP-F2F-G114-C0414]RMB28429.1 putative transcriptional regulator [Sphingomonas sp. PP-F2F-G114-C0414]